MEAQNRFVRLFELMTEIRGNPRQTPKQLARYFGVSKTQFYKDKAELEKLNFRFKYHCSTRSFEEVIWWVRQWGSDAEVLEPKEMREYMLEMAEKEVEMHRRDLE